jgi:UPF0716 protein FxsA
MRRPLALAALLFAVAAIAEIAVLTAVARWIGLPATVLLAFVMSVLGVVLLRREGVRAWRRFRQALDAGEPPGVRVADGLVGLVGALLLVLPGFVTDGLGLLLVAPPTRPLARRAVQRLAERRMPSRMAGDVFGPRRVRVRRPSTPAGTPSAPPGVEVPPTTVPPTIVPPTNVPPPTKPPGPAPADAVIEGEIVEGEIVEPGDRP